MAFRLVAHIDGRQQRFILHEGEMALGSHKQCDIVLRQATVSRRHALIRVDGTSVLIEDLHSRNGVRLGSRRVETARLDDGARILIGAVPVFVEQIRDDDLEPAMVLEQVSSEVPHGTTEPSLGATTFGSGPLETFVIERAPRLLRRLRNGANATVFAQLLGEALYETLNCTAVSIARTGSLAGGADGLMFAASGDSGVVVGAHPIVIERAGYRLLVDLMTPNAAAVSQPLLDLAAEMLAIAGLRDADPSVPTERLEPPPLPDPPTVVPRMRQIYHDAQRVAVGDVPVLILGESGTGKEVLARYVHDASQRAEGPFLGLNCASLPQDLLESELFGIEKGVATGVDARPGKFEQAGGGTLFLDEIGDMAIETQAKILRVLQAGETFRLGAREPRQVDVRIVAATNRNIQEMMSAGTFRADLYHRIATWVVELPPLRRRRGDIANLAAFFLAREAARQGSKVAGISRAAIASLSAFHWPGNVRQLENEMARAVLFVEDGELLDTSRLCDEIRDGEKSGAERTLSMVLEGVERDEMINAIAVEGGQIDAVAQRLGISRATLYRRMKALRIDP